MTTKYDVVNQKQLEELIFDSAFLYIIKNKGRLGTDRYLTKEDVLADYTDFDLDLAVHIGYPLSDQVEQDLSRIEFDNENTEINIDDLPNVSGLQTIGDFTFLGMFAGGDWEWPIIFILYSENQQLRAYIPESGNHYNRSTNQAWGNGDDDDELFDMSSEDNFDEAALLRDIKLHFGLA